MIMMQKQPLYLEKRPSFKAGSQFVPTKTAIRDFLPPPISGKRDDRFKRPSFKRDSPLPRGVKSIAQIERLKTRQQGIKVRLGDATLGKIKVKKRDRLGAVILDAAGQPVFEEVELNFGLLAEMLQGTFKTNMEKLDELAVAIQTGAAASSADVTALGVGLARVLSEQANIARMTQAQLDMVTRSLQLLGISRDPVQAGIQDLIDGRFVTATGWEAAGGRNKGPIIMFLIANVRDIPRLSPNRPVFGRSGAHLQLISIFQQMSTGKVLDLIDKRMYNTVQQARSGAQPAPVFPRFDVPSASSRAVALRGDPGISLEEEDEAGILRTISSIPASLFTRQEGETDIDRLSRSTRAEEAASAAATASQLVPFDSTRTADQLRQQILGSSATTAADF